MEPEGAADNGSRSGDVSSSSSSSGTPSSSSYSPGSEEIYCDLELEPPTPPPPKKKRKTAKEKGLPAILVSMPQLRGPPTRRAPTGRGSLDEMNLPLPPIRKRPAQSTRAAAQLPREEPREQAVEEEGDGSGIPPVEMSMEEGPSTSAQDQQEASSGRRSEMEEDPQPADQDQEQECSSSWNADLRSVSS
ncbi:unnamed protein product [Heligmosomoides polygyrus]|uniref:AT-hook DNA-binding motif-containing protein 1 n=1 Tax=Heligmosomoides polygyrus TaxID=6339 RepID=A0A183FLG3_HELPZ|nr:unnamed protein product [Heligmosomoides polygyrus]